MHLLLPFAAAGSDAGAAALRGLRLPNLERLLGQLQAGPGFGGDRDSLNPPHEQVLAQLRGWEGDDGRLPFAAAWARADGLAPEPGVTGWGLMTPAHWQLGREHVALLDPALLWLDEAQSRQLLALVGGLFESEGWALHWGAPLRWYAQHESLAGLATASLDRVIGRAIEPWLPDRRAAAQLRRLQSETQMLLHEHPINQAREARGELPVNSFWLSGTGRTPAASAGEDEPLVDERLRAPALAGDWAGWAGAWQALDADRLHDLAGREARGEAVSLTLCGERGAQRFDAVPGPAWRRLARRWRGADVAAVLGAL